MPPQSSITPVVSIITPFKNASEFIPSFVSMLLNQTFAQWECIAVDDNSIDHSYELFSSLTLDDPRFRLYKPDYISTPHQTGPAFARNCAIRHSSSDLIAFCDIDDIWHPHKLLLQIPFHIQNNLDISVTGFQHFNHQSSCTINYPLYPPKSCSQLNLLFNNPIPLLTVLIRKSLLSSGFPSVKHEDYALWLRIFSANNIRYGRLSSVLSFYRVHSSNLTSKKVFMPLWAFHAFSTITPKVLPRYLLLISWLTYHFINTISRFILGLSHRPYRLEYLLAQNPSAK